jgi:diguanylate cyclase (GGDEF)-like protein
MTRASAPAATAAVPLPRPLQDLVRTARSRWRASSDGRDTDVDADDDAVAELAAAIGSSTLGVAYQPIIELTTRRPVAVEALVRIDGARSPSLGDAAGVIAVAERSGLISALGTDVLVRACTQLTAWHRDPTRRDLQMHVNVSPHQLRDDRLVEVVERTLQVTDLPARALVVEVTESAAFERDGRAEATLTTLTNLGVEVSIDDFGTGFASLELLASTPARSIKLDRSFTAAVGSDTEPPRGRALMVRAAIGLGHELGLRVVAEGIETEVQARTLASWGCSFGQGYLFAGPSEPGRLRLLGTPAVQRRRDDAGPAAPLSSEAIELALGVATVVANATPGDQVLRSDAVAIAVRLAEATAVDRRAADVTTLLASITDVPGRIADLLPPGGRAAVEQLVTALSATPAIRRAAPIGALAAAARRLARVRGDGRPFRHALASIDPSADPTTHARLAAWWDDPTPSTPVLEELRALERRLRDRDEAHRRLRSLTALTEAIGRDGSLQDVLEVTAEEARLSLGAASLSISRLERDQGVLRTLVNTGDLAAGEEARPTDEVYALSDYPHAASLLIDRAVNVALVDDTDGDPREQELLATLGKGSSVGAPIIVAGTTWGELYATTAVGAPPFTMADAAFVTAIGNVIAVAIRRTEHVEQLARLAGEDPLTRLANRRLLEQRVDEFLASEPTGRELGLLMLDVDGLKDVNDEFGHGEGDALLVRVADVLSRTALTLPGALAARLAGDEFCIVLPGPGHGIEQVVERLRRRLADGPPPQPRLSTGFAVIRTGEADLSELLRRADAAQYRAKRTGVPLVVVGPDEPLPDPAAAPAGSVAPRRRRTAEAGDHGGAARTALARWRHMLDRGSAVQRLESLGDVVLPLLDLNRWLLSEVPAGSTTMRIRSVHTRRRTPGLTPFPPLEEQVYALADFPATAGALERGTGFHVHVDDPSADPDERQLLAELGNRYLIALADTDGDGCGWFLELFGDAESHPLEDAVAVVESLATRTLGREVRCPPTTGR